MKRNKLLFSLAFLPVIAFSLNSCGSSLRGAYVFMHKQSGNPYGLSVYKGVSKWLDKEGIKHADKSPSEQAVSNQVQMIENASMLGAKAVIVSSSGEVGYDNVLKRVTAKGMKIISVDSPISPEYRTMHVDQCDPQAVGSFIARSSVSIAIAQKLNKPDYAEYPATPGRPNEYNEQGLIDITKEAINDFKSSSLNDKIHIAIITSTAASPSQKDWIEAMQKELTSNKEVTDIDYSSVVDIDWMNKHIVFGLDEAVESTNKANALIEGTGNERCDVIANVTSVAAAACGEALKDHYNKSESYKHVKMTGTAMPSELWTYMPDKDSKKRALDYPCPYSVLWNVPDMGYVAAQVAEMAVNGTYKPESEQTFELMDGSTTTIKPVKDDKGHYKLQPLEPLPFHSGNIDYWKTQF